MASEMWSPAMFSAPAKSAMVRATFKNAVVSARAQVQIGHGEFQKLLGRLLQRAIAFQFARTHAGVAGDGRLAREPRLLPLARFDDPFADGGGSFARLLGADVAEFHLRHFDVQINAVQQRPGNAAEIIG